VNACTYRDPFFFGELCNDMLPDLSSGGSNQDLAAFPHDAVLFCYAVLGSWFPMGPKRNESRRYSSAAATDCRKSYGIGLELPAILAVSLISATILGFSRAAAIASRLFYWP
jgi:hypothetical protein